MSRGSCSEKHPIQENIAVYRYASHCRGLQRKENESKMPFYMQEEGVARPE